jgi:ATP-dependent helicase/nuclease subunit A
MMEPTAAQERAIQTVGVPVMVEAGAGTGKTWVLVRRFLYLLEQNPDWPLDSIVAVTFTEKAAAEMRTRIRQEVEKMAAVALPESHWHSRRRDLDFMQVSTIHSLCARILRENAIAARIDPRFEVLDEQETELVREEAIRGVVSDLIHLGRKDESPSLALLAHIQVRDLQEQLARLLEKRGTVHSLFQTLPPVEELVSRWKREIEQARQELWCLQMESNSEVSIALCEIPTIEITVPEDKLAPAVEMAQRGCCFYTGGDLVGAVHCFNEIKSANAGRMENWGDRDRIAAIRLWLKALKEAAKTIEKAGFLAPDELDKIAAENLQCWADLWSRVDVIYKALKNERHSLDFDDLEILAEELLAAQPRSQRLQAYLDGIRQVMVDEFQDTNERQRNITYKLADPCRCDPLFVVGDAKQSIYRFRQAQVAVFNQTAEDIAQAAGQEPVALELSFRSHHSLVTGMNDLFDSFFQPQGSVHKMYEARPGPLHSDRASPPVEVAAPASIELLLLPIEDRSGAKISADDVRLYEAKLLARRLLDLHEQGFHVWDRYQRSYRPFRFSDAAILFRATTSFPLYEEQFKAAGLPYLTVSGRGYYNRPEIRDLVSVIKCLYNPSDDLSLAAALRSPLFSLSDEALYRLRRGSLNDGGEAGEPVPYFKALVEPQNNHRDRQVAFAAETLQALRKLVGRVDVYRLLRSVLDLTGYDALLALSDHALEGSGRQYSNVQKLLELARGWGITSLPEFLQKVEGLRAREAREGEALGYAPESGSVLLMSIHAAKGLEFPVVVVADLGRQKRHPADAPHILFDPAYGLVCTMRDAEGKWQRPLSYAWAKRQEDLMEEAEKKRLLYVACTRAADLLVLSGKPGINDTWIADILNAWVISEDGPDDEIVGKGSFHVRVLRPEFIGEDSFHKEVSLPDLPEAKTYAEPPLFAFPLPTRPAVVPVGVTHLVRSRQKTDEPEGIGPAVYPPGGRSKLPRASPFRIGRLMHKALADWECLSLSEPDLARLLQVYARQEGVLHPHALQQALDKSLRMVNDLRLSSLYQDILSSQVCYKEIPFTLKTEAGVLQGVIDLLYQDAKGLWQLVDWKTEWVRLAEFESKAKEHCFQMSVYAEAVKRELGVYPRVSLCFLSCGARVYSYRMEDLEGAYVFELSRNKG